MKKLLLSLFLCLPVLGFAQKSLSMSEVEGRREISMAEVDANSTSGTYRYYAKGESEPFTGILFGRHDNGQLASWQEYVNGVGQGKWINYYENGNKKEEGNYNQNRVEGPIKKFYEDGSLMAQGTYKDWRVKVGKWTYYKPDGSLETVKDYGQKGSIEEVQQYYDRGEISYSWYSSILKKNGFDID